MEIKPGTVRKTSMAYYQIAKKRVQVTDVWISAGIACADSKDMVERDCVLRVGDDGQPSLWSSSLCLARTGQRPGEGRFERAMSATGCRQERRMTSGLLSSKGVVSV